MTFDLVALTHLVQMNGSGATDHPDPFRFPLRHDVRPGGLDEVQLGSRGWILHDGPHVEAEEIVQQELESIEIELPAVALLRARKVRRHPVGDPIGEACLSHVVDRGGPGGEPRRE
jgi:hypothetical protein